MISKKPLYKELSMFFSPIDYPTRRLHRLIDNIGSTSMTTVYPNALYLNSSIVLNNNSNEYCTINTHDFRKFAGIPYIPYTIVTSGYDLGKCNLNSLIAYWNVKKGGSFPRILTLLEARAQELRYYIGEGIILDSSLKPILLQLEDSSRTHRILVFNNSISYSDNPIEKSLRSATFLKSFRNSSAYSPFVYDNLIGVVIIPSRHEGMKTIGGINTSIRNNLISADSDARQPISRFDKFEELDNEISSNRASAEDISVF